MVIPTVVVISCMWLPVALLFLEKGEAKGTGFITGVVGALVLICSIIHAAVFKDTVLPTLEPFTALSPGRFIRVNKICDPWEMSVSPRRSSQRFS